MEDFQAKYQIDVNHENCIASSTCDHFDPTNFGGIEDSCYKVVGGTLNGKSAGTFEGDKMAKAQAAAYSSPASVITMRKLELSVGKP